MESSGRMVRSTSADGVLGTGPGGMAAIILPAEELTGVSIRVPSYGISCSHLRCLYIHTYMYMYMHLNLHVHVRLSIDVQYINMSELCYEHV